MGRAPRVASVASIAELMGAAGPGVRPAISSAAARGQLRGSEREERGAAVEDKLDKRQERREAE